MFHTVILARNRKIRRRFFLQQTLVLQRFAFGVHIIFDLALFLSYLFPGFARGVNVLNALVFFVVQLFFNTLCSRIFLTKKALQECWLADRRRRLFNRWRCVLLGWWIPMAA